MRVRVIPSPGPGAEVKQPAAKPKRVYSSRSYKKIENQKANYILAQSKK